MELLELIFGYGSVASVAAWLGYEYAGFKAAKLQAKRDEVFFVTEFVARYENGAKLERAPLGTWPSWADDLNPVHNNPQPLNVGELVEKIDREDLVGKMKALADESCAMEVEPKVAFEASFDFNNSNVGSQKLKNRCPWEHSQ